MKIEIILKFPGTLLATRMAHFSHPSLVFPIGQYCVTWPTIYVVFSQFYLLLFLLLLYRYLLIILLENYPEKNSTITCRLRYRRRTTITICRIREENHSSAVFQGHISSRDAMHLCIQPHGPFTNLDADRSEQGY